MVYGTGGARVRRSKRPLTNTITGADSETVAKASLAGPRAAGQWAFASNWSAKIEALYFDLGTRTVHTVDSPADQSVNASHSGVIVRGGINYRFNWGGPVVARY